MRLRYTGVTYERTLALMTGEVQPEGIELEYVAGLPGPLFSNTYTDAGPEASEFSLSNYIIKRSHGDDRYIALPVFPSRVFRHNAVFINVHAGVERPEDLRGKRVGLPDYSQTANYWVRAFLQHDYGVPPESIHWVRAIVDADYRGAPTTVPVEDMPQDKNLSDMLEAGEIAAMINLERPRCFLEGSPNVRRLFPGFRRVEADYYRRTGHFPIMHTAILRRDVYERDPSVARRLYDAFVHAKELSYELSYTTSFLVSNDPFQPAAAEETWALFGRDPFPYGLAVNRHTVGALAQYVYEQGAAARIMDVDELFALNLLDT